MFRRKAIDQICKTCSYGMKSAAVDMSSHINVEEKTVSTLEDCCLESRTIWLDVSHLIAVYVFE